MSSARALHNIKYLNIQIILTVYVQPYWAYRRAARYKKRLYEKLVFNAQIS